MFMCIFSAYYNEEGELVCDFKCVSLNYIKGWFTIDLISNMPWDTIITFVLDTSARSKYYYKKLNKSRCQQHSACAFHTSLKTSAFTPCDASFKSF